MPLLSRGLSNTFTAGKHDPWSCCRAQHWGVFRAGVRPLLHQPAVTRDSPSRPLQPYFLTCSLLWFFECLSAKEEVFTVMSQ